MGREVRMVPANWEHPKDADRNYIPLHDGAKFQKRFDEWNEENSQWEKGLCDDFSKEYPEKNYAPIPEEYRAMSYAEYAEICPDPMDYTPIFKPEEATFYQMYENTSEGTPISPPMATKEKLARWLTNNKAFSCGSNTASYDSWLDTIEKGSAVTFVSYKGNIISGVSGNAKPLNSIFSDPCIAIVKKSSRCHFHILPSENSEIFNSERIALRNIKLDLHSRFGSDVFGVKATLCNGKKVVTLHTVKGSEAEKILLN